VLIFNTLYDAVVILSAAKDLNCSNARDHLAINSTKIKTPPAEPEASFSLISKFF
jgi:hypothetical protein